MIMVHGACETIGRLWYSVIFFLETRESYKASMLSWGTLMHNAEAKPKAKGSLPK